MKKSLLIIATLFLVQQANAQNQIVKPFPYHGNNGNHGYHNTHHNSNTYSNCSSPQVVSCCSPGHNHPNGNFGGNMYGNYVMSNQDLNNVKHAIRNESFSSDKLAIARQAVQFQNIRANQVVAIGNLFSFESDRLEFAKMAYRNTIDKQNYYLVNSIFHFSSSKRELNDFIYR